MLIVLILLILTVIPSALIGFNLWRPKPGLTWIVSIITVTLVWLGLLLLRILIPETFSALTYPTRDILTFPLAILADRISWPIGLATGTALLVFTLLSIVRQGKEASIQIDWLLWPTSMIFGGLSLWAIFSGNLYTLILAWAINDLLWLAVKLISDQNDPSPLTAFGVRLCSLVLVIGALFSLTAGTTGSFPLTSQPASLFLIAGAIVRLTSIAFGQDGLHQSQQRNLFYSFLNLILAAGAITAITRAGISEQPVRVMQIILWLSGLAAVCTGFYFWISDRPQDKLRFWIFSLTAFCLTAYVLGEREATLAWGVALILLGLFYLYAEDHSLPVSPILLIIGLFEISTLPFTPTWQGVRMFPLPYQILEQGVWWIFDLLAFGLILGGLMRLSILRKPQSKDLERWNLIVYPIGLSLLLLIQYILLIFGIPGLSNRLQAFPELVMIWASLSAILLAIISNLILIRSPGLIRRLNKLRAAIFLHNWLSRFIQYIFMIIAGGIKFLDQILEGEGGILWTIFFLLMLLAWLYRANLGG